MWYLCGTVRSRIRCPGAAQCISPRSRKSSPRWSTMSQSLERCCWRVRLLNKLNRLVSSFSPPDHSSRNATHHDDGTFVFKMRHLQNDTLQNLIRVLSEMQSRVVRLLAEIDHEQLVDWCLQVRSSYMNLFFKLASATSRCTESLH